MKHLKYCVVMLCSLMSLGTIAQVPFTAGNIVVCRVGDGSAALGTAATAVFLQEYTPAGTLVQTIPLPTVASGGNFPLVTTGTGNVEGMINRSVDGQYIVITGYGTIPGTTGIATSDGAVIPRVVGLINYNAVINTTTALSDYSSFNRPTSAITTNGTDIWTAGTGNTTSGGPRYTTLGSSTSVQLAAPATTTRNNTGIGIFAGQLYVSRTSSELLLGAVGTGLPTTGGQTVSALPGLPPPPLPATYSGTWVQFVFADLDAGVAGPDVLYVANATGAGTGGLLKYSLVGGSWTANGIVGSNADGYRGLMATVSGTTATLYAVRLNNQIVTLTDASGYNGAFAGTPSVLVTAPVNTAFRGLAAAPVVSGSLPVTISGFSAVKKGRDVVLNWTTSSEKNFSHFEIERSQDGGSFKTTGKVNSNSPGNLHADYSFEDDNVLDLFPPGAMIRYRLKMVDIDQRVEYSRVLPVKIENPRANTVSVYPNPSAGNNDIFLRVSSTRESRLEVGIIDLTGRTLGKTERLRLFTGENIVPFAAFKNLPKGTYLLKMIIDDKISFVRLVKQ